MWQSANDTYLEARVLAADPVELIAILYQGCMGAVRDARRHLVAGDIPARSQAISRAQAILIELAASLDSGAGEIGTRLAGLYTYMRVRLQDANCRQQDAPLEEVLGLLGTLGEAWSDAARQLRASSPAGPVWQEAEMPIEAAATNGHAWSL